MKTVLLAGLLLTGAPALAQKAAPIPTPGQEASAPFKGANVILIHVPDSTGPALKKLARGLIVAGIEPDKIETEIGYLTTRAKPVGQLTPATFEYKAVATAELGGTLLAITGSFTVKLGLVNSMTSPMYWVKGNMLQAKQCFITIQPVAEAYPGGRVAYLLRR